MSKNKNKKRFEVNTNTNNNEDNKMDIQNNEESIEENNSIMIAPFEREGVLLEIDPDSYPIEKEDSSDIEPAFMDVFKSDKGPEHIGEIYRVRLDKDDPSTQIFISNNLDDAIEEANKHPGYMVIDDDGNIMHINNIISGFDPRKEDDRNTMYNYLLPSTGKLVVLKGVPVYRHPNDTKPFREANGKYYFYDYTIINNRAKITENTNIATDPNRNPSMIYGYIDIKQKRN